MNVPTPIEITNTMRRHSLADIRDRLKRIRRKHPEHYATISALFREEDFTNFETARMNYLP